MEESEDKNPVTKDHPSLPPNYVTLTMLKERWLQRKQEEEERKLNPPQHNHQHEAKEETGSGSKDETRNQNRGKSGGPGYVPRRRQQSAKDQSWVRKHEEPESSGSGVISGNEGFKEKKQWERRKPRVQQTVKSPENEGKKEEIPVGVSEESSGKGKICGEFQLDGDDGGVVSVCMVEVVSENGVERDTRKGKGWGRGFKRNKNRKTNSRVYKQVEELGENEKKTEEDVFGVAEDRREKGEKGRQSVIGQSSSSVKIDKSSQDLLLDDRKDGNVSMRVSYQQQGMNSKAHNQVGELGENEKKAEEGVLGVAEDRRKKGEKGRQSGIGQSSWSVKIDKSSQDLLLDDREDGNVRMRVNSNQHSKDSKVHKQVVELGENGKKIEERVVGVEKDRREKGEKGRQSGIEQSSVSVKIDKSSPDLLFDDRKDANWRMRRVSSQKQSINSKVHKQVVELGENEKKSEEGILGVAGDRRETGEKGRQSGIGQSSVKIDNCSQDLLLVDRKDANVRIRVSGQQQRMNSKVHKGVEVAEDGKENGEKLGQSDIGQSSVSVKIDKNFQDMLLDDGKDSNVRMDSKVHKQVGEFRDEEKKVEEEGAVSVAEDGRKNGEEWRIRTVTGPWAKNTETRFGNSSFDNRKYGNGRTRISGRAGGRRGYVGYGSRVARERVEQAENRVVWVKKGENSSGHVTETNSQEVHL